MNKHRPNNTAILGKGGFRIGLALLSILFSSESWSIPNHDITYPPGCLAAEVNFFIRDDATGATDIATYCGTDCDIEAIGFPTNTAEGATGDVYWQFTDVTSFGSRACSDNTVPDLSCGGLNFTIPDTSSDPVSKTEKAILTGLNGADLPSTSTIPPVFNKFKLKVTAVAGTANNCERTYVVRPHTTLSGWGDPHITTVDGVKYDFQSVGEFTSVRGNDIEVQTRQTAVSTQSKAGVNAYTGLASCVSIYTAVALRVGPHRVSIQPNISGVPDPSGLQIRVNGQLRTLGSEGIDLSSCNYCNGEYEYKGVTPQDSDNECIDLSPCNCPADSLQNDGRIQQAADEKSIEIHYADSTKVVVTPGWWNNQQKWYLNINVYDTSASEGIMGRIAEGSWLPALSNGTNVGPKAGDTHDRYVQLYETFADSWRVSNTTSLFDYAPGTSTDTFTLAEWPRENPENCLLEGEPVAEPVDEAVAEEACSGVLDATNKENCIFDVRETGHTGFADTYERTEQIIPGLTQTSLAADMSASKPGTNVSFTANVKRATSTIAKVTSGRIQFLLDGSNVGSPLEFDENGNAIWSTTSLQLGSHEVEAQFIPSAFGEGFAASSSKINHLVSRSGTDNGDDEDEINKWMIIALILFLLLLFMWLKPRLMAAK